MTIDEVAPRSSIEWLWTIDLIELSWDVVRYRSFGQKVPDVHREAAVTRPRLNDRVAASKAEPAAHKRKPPRGGLPYSGLLTNAMRAAVMQTVGSFGSCGDRP